MKQALIVHDDVDIREDWCKTLSRGGLAVVPMASAVEAVGYALSNAPSIVVTPLRLPQLDGMGLLSALRAQTPTAPIPLVMVARAEDLSRNRQAMKLGADDFLFEPLADNDLIDAVQARLRRMDVIRGVGVLTPPGSAAEPAAPENHLAAEVLRELSNVGDYRIVRLLGEGGMSKVYLAQEFKTNREIVLKIMRFNAQTDDNFIRRFIQEHSLLEGVTNRHIVKIYSQGITDDYAYLAMEYFGGGNLREHLTLPLRPQEALNTMIEVCQGVAVLHDANIVHRDLKPDNVMLRTDGSMAISDFGIARDLGAASQATMREVVVGTPTYMAPEQATGKPVSKATDVYALGAMLFEMLSGRKPYPGTDIQTLLYQHISAPIPRLPASLARYQDLIDLTMVKAPNARLPDAHALLAALRSQLAMESMELVLGQTGAQQTSLDLPDL